MLEPDDVLQLLSPLSVAILLRQEPTRCRLITSHIGNMLSYWEVNHVNLDPVQRECVLDSIVLTFTAVTAVFERQLVALAGASGPGSTGSQDRSELHADQGPG